MNCRGRLHLWFRGSRWPSCPLGCRVWGLASFGRGVFGVLRWFRLVWNQEAKGLGRKMKNRWLLADVLNQFFNCVTSWFKHSYKHVVWSSKERCSKWDVSKTTNGQINCPELRGFSGLCLGGPKPKEDYGVWPKFLNCNHIIWLWVKQRYQKSHSGRPKAVVFRAFLHIQRISKELYLFGLASKEMELREDTKATPFMEEGEKYRLWRERSLLQPYTGVEGQVKRRSTIAKSKKCHSDFMCEPSLRLGSPGLCAKTSPSTVRLEVVQHNSARDGEQQGACFKRCQAGRKFLHSTGHLFRCTRCDPLWPLCFESDLPWFTITRTVYSLGKLTKQVTFTKLLQNSMMTVVLWLAWDGGCGFRLKRKLEIDTGFEISFHRATSDLSEYMKFQHGTSLN